MKSFIIRLPENEFSCEIATACVKQAHTFGLEVEMFNGVTGQQATDIFSNDLIQKYPKKLKHDTAGVRGCACSHYLLWKACAAGNEPYLILEQDAFMIRPLPDVLDKFNDVLKLDSCNPFSTDYERDILVTRPDGVTDYDLSWGFKQKAAPYGGYFRGAWSYIIKPHAAQKLVNAFCTSGWVPADKQIGIDLLELTTTTNTIFRIHPRYTSENIQQLSLTRNLK
jgi:GR25 family glycosyltransferase involved in LPS biosynthesis